TPSDVFAQVIGEDIKEEIKKRAIISDKKLSQTIATVLTKDHQTQYTFLSSESRGGDNAKYTQEAVQRLLNEILLKVSLTEEAIAVIENHLSAYVHKRIATEQRISQLRKIKADLDESRFRLGLLKNEGLKGLELLYRRGMSRETIDQEKFEHPKFPGSSVSEDVTISYEKGRVPQIQSEPELNAKFLNTAQQDQQNFRLWAQNPDSMVSGEGATAITNETRTVALLDLCANCTRAYDSATRSKEIVPEWVDVLATELISSSSKGNKHEAYACGQIMASLAKLGEAREKYNKSKPAAEEEADKLAADKLAAEQTERDRLAAEKEPSLPEVIYELEVYKPKLAIQPDGSCELTFVHSGGDDEGKVKSEFTIRGASIEEFRSKLKPENLSNDPNNTLYNAIITQLDRHLTKSPELPRPAKLSEEHAHVLIGITADQVGALLSDKAVEGFVYSYDDAKKKGTLRVEKPLSISSDQLEAISQLGEALKVDVVIDNLHVTVPDTQKNEGPLYPVNLNANFAALSISTLNISYHTRRGGQLAGVDMTGNPKHVVVDGVFKFMALPKQVDLWCTASTATEPTMLFSYKDNSCDAMVLPLGGTLVKLENYEDGAQYVLLKNGTTYEFKKWPLTAESNVEIEPTDNDELLPPTPQVNEFNRPFIHNGSEEEKRAALISAGFTNVEIGSIENWGMYLDRTTKQYYFQMTVPGMSLNRVQILEGLAEKIGMPVRTEKLIINVEKENVNVENRAEGSIDLTEVQVKSLSVMPFELQGAETALVIEVRGAPIEYFSSIGALNTIIKLKEDKDLDLWSRVEGENAREGV
ncbi:MAG: hypothetical protein AAB893_03485, partial [Patescibacteria group bacterium]